VGGHYESSSQKVTGDRGRGGKQTKRNLKGGAEKGAV